eukprot:COSAG02_NODE_4711_length_5071_cov_293.065567_6_plen_72_part_00
MQEQVHEVEGDGARQGEEVLPFLALSPHDRQVACLRWFQRGLTAVSWISEGQHGRSFARKRAEQVPLHACQ